MSDTHKKQGPPIRRSKELQPLSHEHHHGLLLSWKIRTGLKKGVSSDRIGRYVGWFFKAHLLPHFETEEKHFFPLLGNQHPLVQKAVSEHRQLQGLLENMPPTPTRLTEIADTLEAHIRFEERVLFNEIQTLASEEQLRQAAALHREIPFTEPEDRFWE